MKIIHLEAADVEQVELKAVEDLTFMQVIDGDNPQHGGLSAVSFLLMIIFKLVCLHILRSA